MKFFKAIKNKYLSIKSWLFPYYPTVEDVEKFYTEGNSWIDNMTDKEKENYLKPDKNLPLGL